jgi:ketosteroid isomerase-like protein/catechol 2,3-dioxygenase-like lactoylglutathione lyase family enzyme
MLLQGDPEPEKELWSRRDDVTLANPFGGYRRGWPEVEAGLDLAADGFAKGGTCVFEEISREAGPDHGFVFEMERFESNLTDGRGVASGALRVVMIFRVEDSEWKLVHRQADTLTELGAHDDAIHQPVRRMKTLHTAYRVTDLTVSLAFYTTLGYRELGRVDLGDGDSLTMLSFPDEDVVTLDWRTARPTATSRSAPGSAISSSRSMTSPPPSRPSPVPDYGPGRWNTTRRRMARRHRGSLIPTAIASSWCSGRPAMPTASPTPTSLSRSGRMTSGHEVRIENTEPKRGREVMFAQTPGKIVALPVQPPETNASAGLTESATSESPALICGDRALRWKDVRRSRTIHMGGLPMTPSKPISTGIERRSMFTSTRRSTAPARHQPHEHERRSARVVQVARSDVQPLSVHLRLLGETHVSKHFWCRREYPGLVQTIYRSL